MITVLPASWARQNFSEVLILAQTQPMAIARHGQVVAVIWAAGSRSQMERERLLLDYQRRLPALERLLYHREIAMRLLTMRNGPAAVLTDRARQTAEQWRRCGELSQRELQRWQWALERPRAVLAWLIADTGRFANLLRERSPLLTLDFGVRQAQLEARRGVQGLVDQKLEWVDRDPPKWPAYRRGCAVPAASPREAEPVTRLDEDLARPGREVDGGAWQDDAAWSEASWPTDFVDPEDVFGPRIT